mmetsp:Transcript_5167/g.7635  ORF Transcript_5167/g.7635 Transcript_5167/m.7635 type:complete len:275 (-) Transcript_5167:226-1050(-)
MSPTINLFSFLVGLCALMVHGRVGRPSPSEIEEFARQTLARHDVKSEAEMREAEMRDLTSSTDSGNSSSWTSSYNSSWSSWSWNSTSWWNSSYFSFNLSECDNIPMSSSSWTSTFDSTAYFDCLCDCDLFRLNVSISLFCNYQNVSEVMTSCYSSDADTTCDSSCSGVSVFEFYECVWPLYYEAFNSYGICDAMSTNLTDGCAIENTTAWDQYCDSTGDTTIAPTAVPTAVPTVQPTSVTDDADEEVSGSSAFPSSPVSLFSVLVMVALAAFGL